MGFLWKYLKPQKKTLIGALILATINQVFSLIDPQILRIIVDNYATKASEIAHSDFIRNVGLLLLVSVGVAFVSRVAKNFQDYYTNAVTERLGTRMYAESVAHSFSLPYPVFEDQRSGELLEKLQKARTDSQELVKSAINILYLAMVGIFFVVIYGSIVHWSIGLVFFLAIPTIATVTFLISRGIKRVQKDVVRETTSLAGSTTETLRNVELVKSLGLEEQEVDRLNAVNDKILQLELKKIVLIRKLMFTQGTVVNVIRSVLLFLMLWLIFNGAVTVGQFFSLMIYSFFVFSPLGELGTVVAQYQEAKGSVEQLENIMNMKSEVKPSDPVTIDEIRRIALSHVTYTHASAQEPAVRDISWSVNAGETVAFVGPTGSGKTTMVKLILGLYHSSGGAVTFNETATDRIDFDAIRSRIGLVSQETQLFSGTIRDNLQFVKPGATDTECLKVIQAASLGSLLERGRQGLDTKIGEGGLMLSGGEKQRLSIARSLLRNPDMIIFDEATSALDSLTEKSITETIRAIVKARPNLITILVAHRLSTIAHADRITVLEKGRIVEQGHHDDLLTSGGLYAALWREQSAERFTHNPHNKER